VLLKVDRASMHESLEVRVPLLDRDVVEVASRVSWQSCLELDRGIGKLPLRELLVRHAGFQTAGKKGFWVPMDEWLRGPLRGLFEEEVLTRKEIAGVSINNKELRRVWGQPQHGADVAWGMWILLSLALWESWHLKPLRGK